MTSQNMGKNTEGFWGSWIEQSNILDLLSGVLRN